MLSLVHHAVKAFGLVMIAILSIRCLVGIVFREVVTLAKHGPNSAIWNISHSTVDHLFSGSVGQNFPVLYARYIMIAPDSMSDLPLS